MCSNLTLDKYSQILCVINVLKSYTQKMCSNHTAIKSACVMWHTDDNSQIKVQTSFNQKYGKCEITSNINIIKMWVNRQHEILII